MMPAPVKQRLAAAERIMARCDHLAACSEAAEHIQRSYLTAAHTAANELVAEWMSDAGLSVHRDAAGSIIGESPLARAATLALGSHLDTVPNAGAYDGPLGVLLAIEAAAVRDWHALPFALEVIGFGEEEGVRFGTTMLTSRARAGVWDATWWSLTDAAGTSLAEAFRQFGLDPDRIAEACPAKALLGYLEVHIEQGPVLEQLGLPLGIVTAIVGARRFNFTITGKAGHAGTVPMDMRQDALLAASRCVLLVNELARELNLVATVGAMRARPGAVNVIAGEAGFSLDVRAPDSKLLDTFLQRFLDRAQPCLMPGMTLTHELTHDAPAAGCAPGLQAALGTAVTSLGLPRHDMVSGAGHDAMVMAELCDVGMLFVRCAGGVSHHPDEAVTTEDVAWALTALESTIDNLATRHD